MLKKRIVANLAVRDGIVVQSFGFKKYLPIGKPRTAVEFLNQWGIDEIIISDITATINQTRPSFEVFKEISTVCNVPLTIGGGISSISDVRHLLGAGADKVFINSYVLSQPEFINKASSIFGNQCIVVAIDVIKGSDGNYYVYDYRSKRKTSMKAIDWAIVASNRGCGELLINAVDRDGSYSGYDLPLANLISTVVKIPVIVCGGAGNPSHILDVFNNTSVAAAAVGNYFHFNEHSVIKTKAFLRQKGLDVRLETSATYIDHEVDNSNRLFKRSDDSLDTLHYVKLIKESI